MRSVMTFILLCALNHLSFAAEVSQFDVKKIKLGSSISEVNKILSGKKYYENLFGEDDRGVYYMHLYTKDEERINIFFTQDVLGKKLYHVSYQTTYFDDPQYATDRFNEMQSQMKAKYGEPTDILQFIPEKKELTYCWGDCSKATVADRGGKRLTATTFGKLLTLELDDYTQAKDVLSVEIKLRSKKLDDFLSEVNKYATGLSLTQANKIFTDIHKRAPQYQNDFGGPDKYNFVGPQLYEFDGNKSSLNISFTGKESESQFDNRIYKVNSSFRVDDSRSGAVNSAGILNSFVQIYGTPADRVQNENHLEACWGVCMKDRIGSFYSNRRRSIEAESVSEGRRIILEVWKASVSFEQYDFALAYQYGKAKSELQEKKIKNKVNL